MPSKTSREARGGARGGDDAKAPSQGGSTKFEFMGISLKLPDVDGVEVEVDPEVEENIKKGGTSIGTGLAAGGGLALLSAFALSNPIIGAVGFGAAAVAAVVTNLPEAEEEVPTKRSKSKSKSKTEDAPFIDEQTIWDVVKGSGGFFAGCGGAFALAALYGFAVSIPFLAGGIFGGFAVGAFAWSATGYPLPDGISWDGNGGIKLPELPEIKSGMMIGDFEIPDGIPFIPPRDVIEEVEDEGFNPFSWLPKQVDDEPEKESKESKPSSASREA